MTTSHSTDAGPTPALLKTSPSPEDPRPPARWREPSPEDPRPVVVSDSSSIGLGAPSIADSHLRIGGELAGRLLRSARWQQ